MSVSFNRHIKHWFIPHRRNNHRPHIMRTRGLVMVLSVIITIQTVGWLASPAAVRPSLTVGRVLAYASDITPSGLFTATNQERSANGLAPLTLDARLEKSSCAKAQDMFTYNYWAHVSPSGVQPWFWFEAAGYQYRYAGENLARDFDTTSGVMTGWMNSPEHRANILNANYTNVGFCVMNGTLTGSQTTLVVAHYGQAGSGVSVAAVVATPAPQPALSHAAAITITPTPQATVTPQSEVTTLAPTAQSYNLVSPLALTRTLVWPAAVTLIIILLLFSVHLATHLVVWRRRLKRWRNLQYQTLAIAQLIGLAVVMTLVAVSGFGRVG